MTAFYSDTPLTSRSCEFPQRRLLDVGLKLRIDTFEKVFEWIRSVELQLTTKKSWLLRSPFPQLSTSTDTDLRMGQGVAQKRRLKNFLAAKVDDPSCLHVGFCGENFSAALCIGARYERLIVHIISIQEAKSGRLSMLPPPPEDVVKKGRKLASSDMPRSLQRMLQLKVCEVYVLLAVHMHIPSWATFAPNILKRTIQSSKDGALCLCRLWQRSGVQKEVREGKDSLSRQHQPRCSNRRFQRREKNHLLMQASALAHMTQNHQGLQTQILQERQMLMQTHPQVTTQHSSMQQLK